jgi:hypothetical protein
MTTTTRTAQNDPRRAGRWSRRLGLAGFMFFFVKGLLWLAAPFLLVWWGTAP